MKHTMVRWPGKAVGMLTGCALMLGVLFGSVWADSPSGDATTLPRIVTFWGPYVDEPTDAQWPDVVNALYRLRSLGFTHAGLHMGDTASAVIGPRLDGLRGRGFLVALHHSPGERILTQPTELDPSTHPSNGQNVKYFDSTGFNPYHCYGNDYSQHSYDCSQRPHVTAHDPAYTGIVWQRELGLLDSMLRVTNLVPGELVLFDAEVWSFGVDYYYPNTLSHSVSRYHGSPFERSMQYTDYWGQRGRELRDLVKQSYPEVRTLFFGEESGGSAYGQTWMPAGTGDASSPELYKLSDLASLQSALAQGDFSRSYPWVSFSMAWRGDQWVMEPWDPRITQKAAFLLRQAGVKGVIEYPGPLSYNIPIDRYLAHARAFINGFVNGIDPGSLQEVCGDGMDNDGDRQIDEAECVPASPADRTAPTVPTHLVATAASSSRVTLTWGASSDPVVPGGLTSGVAGYTIFRNGFIMAAGVTTTRYADAEALQPSTAYTYALWAEDAAGNHSALSIPVSVTTLATLTASTPPTGAIDARNINASTPSFKDVTLTFSGSVAGISANDFSVSSSYVNAPGVARVSPGDAVTTATLSLSRPLMARERVTITHHPSGSKVCLGFLPGDVNGDGTTAPADWLDLIDAVNGRPPTRPLYATDIDRSGVLAPADMLAFMDLLNGGWNGKTVPACGAPPPLRASTVKKTSVGKRRP